MDDWIIPELLPRPCALKALKADDMAPALREAPIPCCGCCMLPYGGGIEEELLRGEGT